MAVGHSAHTFTLVEKEINLEPNLITLDILNNKLISFLAES